MDPKRMLKNRSDWDWSFGWVKPRTQYCKYASKLKNGKTTQTDSAVSVRHSCQKTGECLSRMTSRQNGVRDQAYHTRKQQTARQHSVHWWLGHQRPVRVRFHCQERCDHHPWRQCSPYGPNLQLNKGGGSSHSCPPLDFLKKETVRPHKPLSSQIQRACYKTEKWNRKPRMVCVGIRHASWETPAGVLSRSCLGEGEWSSR